MQRRYKCNQYDENESFREDGDNIITIIQEEERIIMGTYMTGDGYKDVHGVHGYRRDTF